MTLLLLVSCFLGGEALAQIKKDSIPSSLPVNQKSPLIETRELFKRKGNLIFYWGYNRSAYSHSNINFRGDGYNFTINNISASDEQTPLSTTYINPGTISVPQYNLRAAYYINDKTYISVGIDHMKYTINKQVTRLTGTITKDNNNGKNIGTYNNTEVLVGDGGESGGGSVIDALPKGFVGEFEHCDGLNDVSFEIGRLEQLWLSKNSKNALSVVGGVGAGMVVPDTDADVLGYPPKHDMEQNKKAFHLAGYSVSAAMGLQLDFFKRFFLLARVKAGYINLPDINTTTTGGKASQHFCFVEPMMVAGYTISLAKH
ncbi:MAG: hypothetical protein ACYDEC_02235 [Bacteroidia bacterium]